MPSPPSSTTASSATSLPTTATETPRPANKPFPTTFQSTQRAKDAAKRVFAKLQPKTAAAAIATTALTNATALKEVDRKAKRGGAMKALKAAMSGGSGEKARGGVTAGSAVAEDRVNAAGGTGAEVSASEEVVMQVREAALSTTMPALATTSTVTAEAGSKTTASAPTKPTPKPASATTSAATGPTAASKRKRETKPANTAAAPNPGAYSKLTQRAASTAPTADAKHALALTTAVEIPAEPTAAEPSTASQDAAFKTTPDTAAPAPAVTIAPAAAAPANHLTDIQATIAALERSAKAPATATGRKLTKKELAVRVTPAKHGSKKAAAVKQDVKPTTTEPVPSAPAESTAPVPSETAARPTLSSATAAAAPTEGRDLIKSVLEALETFSASESSKTIPEPAISLLDAASTAAVGERTKSAAAVNAGTQTPAPAPTAAPTAQSKKAAKRAARVAARSTDISGAAPSKTIPTPTTETVSKSTAITAGAGVPVPSVSTGAKNPPTAAPALAATQTTAGSPSALGYVVSVIRAPGVVLATASASASVAHNLAEVEKISTIHIESREETIPTTAHVWPEMSSYPSGVTKIVLNGEELGSGEDLLKRMSDYESNGIQRNLEVDVDGDAMAANPEMLQKFVDSRAEWGRGGVQLCKGHGVRLDCTAEILKQHGPTEVEGEKGKYQLEVDGDEQELLKQLRAGILFVSKTPNEKNVTPDENKPVSDEMNMGLEAKSLKKRPSLYPHGGRNAEDPPKTPEVEEEEETVEETKPPAQRKKLVPRGMARGMARNCSVGQPEVEVMRTFTVPKPKALPEMQRIFSPRFDSLASTYTIPVSGKRSKRSSITSTSLLRDTKTLTQYYAKLSGPPPRNNTISDFRIVPRNAPIFPRSIFDRPPLPSDPPYGKHKLPLQFNLPFAFGAPGPETLEPHHPHPHPHFFNPLSTAIISAIHGLEKDPREFTAPLLTSILELRDCVEAAKRRKIGFCTAAATFREVENCVVALNGAVWIPNTEGADEARILATTEQIRKAMERVWQDWEIVEFCVHRLEGGFDPTAGWKGEGERKRGEVWKTPEGHAVSSDSGPASEMADITGQRGPIKMVPNAKTGAMKPMQGGRVVQLPEWVVSVTTEEVGGRIKTMRKANNEKFLVYNYSHSDREAAYGDGNEQSR